MRAIGFIVTLLAAFSAAQWEDYPDDDYDSIWNSRVTDRPVAVRPPVSRPTAATRPPPAGSGEVSEEECEDDKDGKDDKKGHKYSEGRGGKDGHMAERIFEHMKRQAEGDPAKIIAHLEDRMGIRVRSGQSLDARLEAVVNAAHQKASSLGYGSYRSTIDTIADRIREMLDVSVEADVRPVTSNNRPSRLPSATNVNSNRPPPLSSSSANYWSRTSNRRTSYRRRGIGQGDLGQIVFNQDDLVQIDMDRNDLYQGEATSTGTQVDSPPVIIFD